MPHPRTSLIAVAVAFLALAGNGWAIALAAGSLFSPGSSQTDTIHLTNQSSPGVRISSVVIDLQPSRGGLSLVCPDSSPGFRVLRDGSAGLENVSGNAGDQSLHGASQLILDFASFDPGEIFSFALALEPANPAHPDDSPAALFAQTMFTVYFQGADFGFSRLFGTYQEVDTCMAGVALHKHLSVPPVVPEPATLLLFAVGLAGLSLAGRRSR